MTGSTVTPLGKSTLTIADLITQIQDDASLNDQQRRVNSTSMVTVVRIVAGATRDGITTAATIPCDVALLNSRLFHLSPKAHGLKKESFNNVVSLLRGRLRLNGLLDTTMGVALSPGSPWTALLEGIKDAHCRYGLTKFAAWCDRHGIAPSQVQDGTLAAFEAHVRTRHLRPDIPGFISTIAKSWRKAATLSAAWPAGAPNSPARRERYTQPFSAYSAALQDDVARFEKRLSATSGRGPFQTEGFFQPLRPRSVATRLYSLRQALHALVAGGRDPASIIGLHQLVTPEAMEEILLFYWKRAVEARIARGDLDADSNPTPGDGSTSQTSAMGAALMIVARYHVRLPKPELDALAQLAVRVRSPMTGTISPRNRALLDELCEPAKRRDLLRLPATLMTMADRLVSAKPFQAGLLAMTSVAIEIEFNKPLRLANLAELKLGEDLQFTDPRSGRPTLLRIPAWKVKNAYAIEWPLSPELGERIRHYLVHHRPNLGPADSPWLFPAPTSAERPRCHDTLRRLVTGAIAEHVGVRMHIHLFRAFMGVLLLDANPGGLEDLRLLLDHKTIETSLAYYAYRQPAEVAGRMNHALKQARGGMVPGQQLNQQPGQKPGQPVLPRPRRPGS